MPNMNVTCRIDTLERRMSPGDWIEVDVLWAALTRRCCMSHGAPSNRCDEVTRV
jgi:hypothetical protein